MKLKTSFFNPAAFKKNILRFSPVWALYTIAMLLVFFGMSGQGTVYIVRDIVYIMPQMAAVNIVYAGVCAMFLFGDLFNQRLCNALHAFPVRREGWLLTGVAAGVLFSVVPNLLMSLLACTVIWDYAYIAFIWLALSTLQFLFFFGTAVLSTMCAGNRLGMIAVYGIIQFITALVFGLMEMIYVPLLYGVKLNLNDLTHFFPVGHMVNLEYVEMEYVSGTKLYFQGLYAEAWRFLALCAAAGVASIALAWFVYRRRPLESAGDFVAFHRLSPVFLVIFSVGAGAVLYAFSDLIDSKSYVFLAIGLVIGYFAGRMLLGRTLRVFNKKSLVGFAVLVVVLAGSLGLTWLDPLGVSGSVPNIDEIEWAAVFDNGYIFEGSNSQPRFEITDSREIAKLQSFHRQLIDRKDEPNSGHTETVQIQYKLHNGKTVKRYYEIPHEGELAEQAKVFFSDMRYLFKNNSVDRIYASVAEVNINWYTETENENGHTTDKEILKGLLDAIKADCEAGKMAQNWLQHKGEGEYHLSFTLKQEDDGDYWRKWCDLYITEQCTNTVAYLKTVLPLMVKDEK